MSASNTTSLRSQFALLFSMDATKPNNQLKIHYSKVRGRGLVKYWQYPFQNMIFTESKKNPKYKKNIQKLYSIDMKTDRNGQFVFNVMFHASGVMSHVSVVRCHM